MMTMESIDSNSPIEGVIKADDDASLRIELEEYVLTNEIEKQIEKFLDAYKNYTTANGVWISGFFGSGKSHLLKMLAMVLETVIGALTIFYSLLVVTLFVPVMGGLFISGAGERQALAAIGAGVITLFVFRLTLFGPITAGLDPTLCALGAAALAFLAAGRRSVP